MKNAVLMVSCVSAHRSYVISWDRDKGACSSCIIWLCPQIVCNFIGKITWRLLSVLHMQEVCYLVRWKQSMSIPFSQGVCDLVESMQNLVLMGSPYFSSTACTRSCWIDAKSCAHGISSLFHREYVISFDQCRIVRSWKIPVLSRKKVRNLVGSM